MQRKPLCKITTVNGALQEEDLRKRLPDCLRLIRDFHEVDVSQHKDFKDTYSRFFTFRGKQLWENVAKHFNFMQELKESYQGVEGNLTFGTVLEGLHKKLKILTPSFSSKLLSIVNPEMPVWDSKVRAQLKNFGVIRKVPSHYRQKAGNKCPNIDKWHEFYTEEICGWYNGFVESEEAKTWIEQFDEQYPEAKGITKVKKIDLILWQIR